MIKERFEARGTLAAVIEVRREAEFDGKLADVIGEAEEKFLERARIYARARADAVSKMRAAERRRVRPDKISLVSSAAADSSLTTVTVTASVTRDGRMFTRENVVIWDESSQIMVKKPKTKRKKAVKREKSAHQAR